MANSNMQATDAVAQDTASASGEFDALLNQAFRPKTTQAAKAVEAAVQTLAQQALANTITVSDDAYKSISAIIAQIDFKLTEQIKLILQHPDWQKLESSWRGMEHLVYNTETDEKLKIRFMNLSKDELRRNMKRYKGIAWDQSPMWICLALSPKSPRRPMRRLLPGLPPRYCKWTPGRNWRIPAT